MSLHTAAKYLASKGRDGDSMLVHMTPGEVKGLQSLALAHGGSLNVRKYDNFRQNLSLTYLILFLKTYSADYRWYRFKCNVPRLWRFDWFRYRRIRSG